MKTFSRWPRRTAGLVAAGLMAASCAWQGGGASVENAGTGPQADFTKVGLRDQGKGTPVKGGTLTFSAYTEAGLLDPADTTVAGSTGGIEMAAVYDVLMRWDDAAGALKPQLAKGLEAGDDGLTWTLTLRDGVRFSDGTALNAEAVKWSIERYVKEGADGAELWKQNVESIETPDDLTVVFNLNEKWEGFGHLFTTGLGMIVAESAVEGEKFKPVGAGPFQFESYAPAEEMILTARADYWDGRPNLDRVRIVYVNDPNARLDSLNTGRIQAAFLRDPVVAQEALTGGYQGYLNLVSVANVAIINGNPGHPGADPRVRKAMFHAIKPDAIFKRAYPGVELASNKVFPEFSKWHSDVQPLAYDPEKARRLLEQAKADGYDGKVSWLDGQDPASRTTALAAKAMLENVGFDVKLDLVRSIADQITKVAVKKSYDVSAWGISWRESGPFARMYATMHAEGKARYGMPASKEMSALIEKLQGAATIEDKRQIMADIQRQWNQDVPALIFGPMPELVAWPEKVNGVVGTANSMVLLDDAWIAQ